MTPDLAAFLVSLAAGAVLLLVWDMLHALRIALFHGTASNFILDTAWWVFAAILIVRVTWETNFTNLRIFIVAALALGAWIYHITLSRLIRRLFSVIFVTILNFFKFIFKILLTPTRFLYKILLEDFLKHHKRGKI